jgi:hypothetical protein
MLHGNAFFLQWLLKLFFSPFCNAQLSTASNYLDATFKYLFSEAISSLHCNSNLQAFSLQRASCRAQNILLATFTSFFIWPKITCFSNSFSVFVPEMPLLGLLFRPFWTSTPACFLLQRLPACSREHHKLYSLQYSLKKCVLMPQWKYLLFWNCYAQVHKTVINNR